MDSKAHATPSDVVAEEGEVIVDGPDGVAVSFTPAAAAETSDRLMEAAGQARGQKLVRQEDSDAQRATG